jgi:ADP-ribose pyrophosphatase YjhB (NUDIX family)
MPQDISVQVTSPLIALEDYATSELPMRGIIEAMCGDLQRCRLYTQPPFDYQVPVDISDEVWGALSTLASAGFTGQLMVDRSPALPCPTLGHPVFQGPSYLGLPRVPSKVCTLLFLRHRGRVLLGLKKRGFGQGRWNGFGGKLEPREPLLAGALREMREESGVALNGARYVGFLRFQFQGASADLHAHVFVAGEADGLGPGVAGAAGAMGEGTVAPEGAHGGAAESDTSELAGGDRGKIGVGEAVQGPAEEAELARAFGAVVESEEMRPEWFSEGSLPLSEMWVDDALWLPHLLSGRRFTGRFFMEGHTRIADFDLEVLDDDDGPASDVCPWVADPATTVLVPSSASSQGPIDF